MILGYNENIMLLTDSYKTSHYKQYPPKVFYLSGLSLVVLD